LESWSAKFEDVILNNTPKYSGQVHGVVENNPNSCLVLLNSGIFRGQGDDNTNSVYSPNQPVIASDPESYVIQLKILYT
jgi:hypothetical protein